MKITIKNFQKKIPINPTRIRKTILKVLSSEAPQRPCEINICFVNENKIKELNRIYLGKDNSTDVIAFDLSLLNKPERMLADIVISTDAAISNSKLYNTAPLYEVCLYIIHGLLHLLGYDDKTLRQQVIMRKKEKELLKTGSELFFKRKKRSKNNSDPV